MQVTANYRMKSNGSETHMKEYFNQYMSTASKEMLIANEKELAPMMSGTLYAKNTNLM